MPKVTGVRWSQRRRQGRGQKPGLISDQRGSVLILFAIAMVALTGFAAISLDAGWMYATHARLSNIADAAALAGADYLPDDPGMAYAVALDCAVQNGIAAADVQVSITENNTRIDVHLQGPAELRFASVGGSKKVTLPADSAGAIYVVTGVVGAVPFGVESAPFVYGREYAIKLGPNGTSDGDATSYSGNFHAMALATSGASQYRSFVETGYPGLLTVGQSIDTEPGNMAGPTSAGVQTRMNETAGDTFGSHPVNSARVMLLPIVDSFDVNGRKSVTIRGFAAFFLEGFDSSGSGTVYGRFMRYHTSGQVSAYRPDLDYGVRMAKLVR